MRIKRVSEWDKFSSRMTPTAKHCFGTAQNIAQGHRHAYVEGAHLLLGILQIEAGPNTLLRALTARSGLKWDELQAYAQSAILSETVEPQEQPQLTTHLTDILKLAERERQRTGTAQIEPSHLFIACFRPLQTPGVAEVLAPLGVSADQLSLHLRQLARGEAATSIQNESPLAQLTGHGERALEAAQAAMRANFCGRISTLHLLIGVLENPDSDVVAALQTLMINVEELKERAAVAVTGDGEIAGPNRRFTPAAKRALDRAKAAARDGGRSHIGSADLLMGLLPQPLLLIERAQFGARPDDPAAALLREVDADLVRAIFNPQHAATPPTKPRFAPGTAFVLPAKWFAVFFGIDLSICLAMEALGAWQKNAVRSSAALGLMSLLVAVLIGSGLFACGMLLFSRNPSRKVACQWSFFGALAGVMFGMAASGVFK